MIFRQGELDGFCGFYVLVNFIVEKDMLPGGPYEQARAAFRYLMESAEELRLLTAHRIWDGFEWPLLLEVFNHWASRYAQPFRAKGLAEVMALDVRPTTRKVLSRIVEAGGGAMLSTAGGNHWVLVAHNCDEAGFFQIFDSASSATQQPRKKFDDLSTGLALLPVDSELLKELNAQMY